MEFAETNESFRTIALYNANLHNIIKNLNINESNVKLTLDQKYITQSMGMKLPFFTCNYNWRKETIHNALYYSWYGYICYYECME